MFDLKVKGQRRTTLVESVERQIEVVRGVLTAAGLRDVPIAGALCMADPENLPLFKRLKIREIAIDGTRRIAELAGRPGELDERAVERITNVLEQGLPPA